MSRWMMFVDGTNILVELSKYTQKNFRADKPPFAALETVALLLREIYKFNPLPFTRRYWFASYNGDEEYYFKYREKLRSTGFEPVLFKKRGGREKGVDIALTREMLVNAFNQNFDHGIIVAGDEDYVSLVNEVKRYGQTIEGMFFEKGLSKELKIACDRFSILSNDSEFKIFISKLDSHL